MRSEVCLALRNTSGIDDDSNDALATMAFPAKLVNAIRSSTEILVEERSRAYLSQVLASGDGATERRRVAWRIVVSWKITRVAIAKCFESRCTHRR